MDKCFQITVFLFLFGNLTMFSQEINQTVIVKDTITTNTYDPLRPSKAAFYSAILPGMGQAYNKRYWKIPIVYGAIGTSLYFYADNSKKYNDYRDAYKRRLAGYEDDKYQYLDNNRLIEAQKFYQRNRDLSLLFAVGFYVLNIVDANVDAHLMQFNVNKNLSFRPEIYQNQTNYKTNIGLSLNFKL